MIKPPLLPAQTVARMLRVAKFDGTSVLVLCGGLALASAAVGDFTGAFIGVVIAAAGAFELHGAALIQGGHPRGVNWLIGSQLYLLAAILAYVGWRLASYDAEAMRRFLDPVFRTPEMQAKFSESGVTEADMLRMWHTMYFIGFRVVGLVTLLYQGGMALYYHRRRAAVAAVLVE